MKKRYLAVGVLGTIAAGAVAYKRVKKNKDSDIILYPICRVTMHIDGPVIKLEKLVKKAEVIIKGEVLDISGPRWNNKDNKQPKNIGGKDVIYKDYYIKCSETLKGNNKVNEVVRLRAYEGEISGFTVEDNSQIILEKGQEIFAFLIKDTSQWNKEKDLDFFVPFGEIQGVYILKDNTIKNVNEELEITAFSEQLEKELNK